MNSLFNKVRIAGAVALMAASTFAATGVHAQDRRVTIVNNTKHTMIRFFASNVSRDNWEEDILGDRVVKPGASVKINIDDGSGACLFDFKAEFDDGDKLVRNKIDVCKISTYTYTEN